MKAILPGDRGGELVTSDVGVHKRSSKEELTRNGTTLTTRRRFTAEDFANPYLEAVPHAVQRALINQHSVPDALMYNHQHNEFTMVEIKYCRDTDRSTQHAKATQQHEHLCTSISGASAQTEPGAQGNQEMTSMCAAISDTDYLRPSVRQVTILLGVTGVIFTETEQQMTNLGVKGSALKKLLRDLHYIAINGMERIWKQRGALLKHLGHLKLNNCSKNKRANMKRAFKAPNHRKHVKRRKS